MPTEEQELQHFGVPGMKWGVRKSARSGKIRPRTKLSLTNRRVASLVGPNATAPDAMKQSFNSTMSSAAGSIRRGIRNINKAPEYKRQNFKEDSPTRKKYYNDISKMFEKQYSAAANKRKNSISRNLTTSVKIDVGTSSFPQIQVTNRQKGTAAKNTKLDAKEQRKQLRANTKQVKHADGSPDEYIVTIDVEVDGMGFITDIIWPKPVAHTGVLGMKWGVRRDRSTSSKKGKTAIADIAAEQRRIVNNARNGKVLDKRDIRKLSDTQLQQVIDRKSLERSYGNLTKSSSIGKKFVSGVLTDSAKKTATKLAAEGMEALLRKGMKAIL